MARSPSLGWSPVAGSATHHTKPKEKEHQTLTQCQTGEMTTQSEARVLVVGFNPGGILGTFDRGDCDRKRASAAQLGRASEYSVGTRERSSGVRQGR